MRLRHQAAPAALLGLCAAELTRLLLGWDAAGMAAAICLAIFLLVGQRLLGTRERFLLAMAVLVTLVAARTQPEFGTLLSRAAQQAAFLAAFMILLTLLRDGAATSPAVLELGSYLTRQPPGRRYLATHVGSLGLGVVLNMGALSLLGPMIQRGARGSEGSARLAQIRERRQLSALSRGVAWFVAWSPTAITHAIVTSMIPGVDPLRLIGLGAGVAALVLLVAWTEDRMIGTRLRRQLRADEIPRREPTPVPRRALTGFAAVCGALAALGAGFAMLAGLATVPALMAASPLVTAGWIALQNRSRTDGADARAATRARLAVIATRSIPASSPEAVTLAIAGYAGAMAAGLVDAVTLAEALGLAALPPLAIYAGVMALIPIAANLAIPAMLTSTFLGGLFASLPMLPVDPTLLGLSIVLGWTLNLTASPFSGASLVLARVTGLAGSTLAWRWNGAFSLAAWVTCTLAMAAFTITG